VIFDASKVKDGQADMTNFIVTNIINNDFIQSTLKIRKLKLTTPPCSIFKKEYYTP